MRNYCVIRREIYEQIEEWKKNLERILLNLMIFMGFMKLKS